MKKTPHQTISSLVIFGTASILSLSYANYAQSSNLVNIVPREQKIPTELLMVNNTNQRKYALIIGNANYQEVGTLANPVNDAEDMGKTLRELGFEVTVITNASLRQMDDSLNDFNAKLRGGGIGLFFYAGHGVQVDGENYLIPVEAKLARKEDVRYETLPVGKVLNAMEDAKNNANFIILDACRNNPFGRNWRSLDRGLAAQQSITGSIIAYATAPGKVAGDGSGRNGTYTNHLLKNLKTPGISVEELFKRVRQGVAQETGQKQIPWESSSLIGDFSFNPTQPPPDQGGSGGINTTTTPPLTNTKPITPTTPPNNNSNNQVVINKPTNPTPQPPPDQGGSGGVNTSKITLIAAAPNANKQQMYAQLEQYLADGNFRKADEQTWELMKQVGNDGKQGYLTDSEVENFSCHDLRNLDQLWVKYSNGKFGFSVQRKIWESFGVNPNPYLTWQRFMTVVGWKTGSENSGDGYKDYDELTFSLLASPGHLPSRYGFNWVHIFSAPVFDDMDDDMDIGKERDMDAFYVSSFLGGRAAKCNL